jgi:hypothetical protein
MINFILPPYQGLLSCTASDASSDEEENMDMEKEH